MNDPRESRRPVAAYVWGFTFALACLFLASCGQSDRVAVTPVRGQVFASPEEPAAGAMVVFHPLETEHVEAPKPIAYVDDKGEFELTTYDRGDGAPPGEYVITVEWREKPSTPFSPDKEGEDRLRGKYADPTSSEFRFTVDGESEHVVPAIHLE